MEPYESGLLEVSDGHSLYWETVGDPAGTPAVYLHGRFANELITALNSCHART